MLPDTLSSNQVKDASGAEIEFTRLEQVGRTTRFSKTAALGTAFPTDLRVKHEEVGSGIKKVVRSVIRFDETSLSEVDGVSPIVDSIYVVQVTNRGHHTTTNVQKRLIAQLNSFLALDGSGTTALLDGTGTGAQVLLTGAV
jgi:hypothetical protein